MLPVAPMTVTAVRFDTATAWPRSYRYEPRDAPNASPIQHLVFLIWPVCLSQHAGRRAFDGHRLVEIDYPPQISGCSKASVRPSPHRTAWAGLARSPGSTGCALRVSRRAWPEALGLQAWRTAPALPTWRTAPALPTWRRGHARH